MTKKIIFFILMSLFALFIFSFDYRVSISIISFFYACWAGQSASLYFRELRADSDSGDAVFKKNEGAIFSLFCSLLTSLIPAVILFGVFLVTKDPIWIVCSCLVVLLTLFYSLPIYPLKGGQIIKRISLSFGRTSGYISTSFGIAFAIIVAIFAKKFAIGYSYLFLSIAVIGLLEIKALFSLFVLLPFYVLRYICEFFLSLISKKVTTLKLSELLKLAFSNELTPPMLGCNGDEDEEYWKLSTREVLKYSLSYVFLVGFLVVSAFIMYKSIPG